MAPKYQLVYFNAMSRAEISRFMFAHAGVEYEDKRIQFEEWKDVKPTLPLGQLPVLRIDGYELPQSMAIARYVAKEFGMFGSNNLEAAKIDAMVDTINELFEATVKAKWAPTDEAKAAANKALADKTPTIVKFIDAALEKNESGWLVGDKVSIADFVLLNLMFVYKGVPAVDKFHAELKSCARIAKHHQKVANLPKIKEWLAKRPITEL